LVRSHKKNMKQEPQPTITPERGREASAWIAPAALAVRGDDKAFARLVEIFQEEIHRMVYFRTGSAMDAEDITQEVFLKAFRHIGRLKDPRHLRGWLYRIALNSVRDHHRRRRVRMLFEKSARRRREEAPVGQGAPAAGVEQILLRREFWDRIRGLMDRLSRLEKEVFMLRFFDELKIREISIVLKRSESTVKTHLHRAIKKLAGAHELFERTEGS